MQQNTPRFSWDSYGSVRLSLVMQGVSKKEFCNSIPNVNVWRVLKMFTLKGVSTIHRSRWNSNIWKTIVKLSLKHSAFI
jgi:hypothetical protein